MDENETLADVDRFIADFESLLAEAERLIDNSPDSPNTPTEPQ